MAASEVTVCDHLSDFYVMGLRGAVAACWCHLGDAVVFASPCMVFSEPSAMRICGANRTFPAQSHTHTE